MHRSNGSVAYIIGLLSIQDNSSHFRTRLEQLQQLSLAPSFVAYADHVYSLSESFPLLLHNWKDVTESWLVTSRAAGEAKDDGEGYKPLLQFAPSPSIAMTIYLTCFALDFLRPSPMTCVQL
jgi:hypothetical protein